jgi:hypothetical protein
VVSSLCVSYYDIEYAAACEQSKELALGKMLVRCRWQKKDKHFGAAVDKIEEKRKPEDFIGHRKPATKPKMPQVRILSSGPYRVFITDLTVVDTRFFMSLCMSRQFACIFGG